MKVGEVVNFLFILLFLIVAIPSLIVGVIFFTLGYGIISAFAGAMFVGYVLINGVFYLIEKKLGV